jgi:hypothetical protein
MPESMATVASFSTLFEAEMARNRLEEEGIPTFLADTELVGMAWHLAQAVGGVKLQVRAKDVERAREVLEDMPRPAAPEDSDPVETESLRAVRAAALGVMFPPLQLYSLWVIVKLLVAGRPLDAKAKRRVAFAAVLDLCVFAFAAYIVLLTMGSDCVLFR